MTEDQVNDLAKRNFERLCGRPHPWEGVQPWVLAAMRDAYTLGIQNTPHPQVLDSTHVLRLKTEIGELKASLREILEMEYPASCYDAQHIEYENSMGNGAMAAVKRARQLVGF